MESLAIGRLRYIEHRLAIGFVLGPVTVELLRAGTTVAIHGEAQPSPLSLIASFSLMLGGLVLAFAPRRWFQGHFERWWARSPTYWSVSYCILAICTLAVEIVISRDWPSMRTAMAPSIAFALGWAGLRWRDGDDLVCARCEYPKTPESKNICPECGNAWTNPDALNLGRVRPVPWMIFAGATVIGIDLVLVALNG